MLVEGETACAAVVADPATFVGSPQTDEFSPVSPSSHDLEHHLQSGVRGKAQTKGWV